MKNCCDTLDTSVLKKQQKDILVIVLILNAFMFFVEFSFGILSHSTSLLADSLDMLGDAIVYAFSLYVIDRSLKWKAAGALMKGSLITVLGLYVLGEAIYKIIFPVLPIHETMTVIGSLALVTNAICLGLLLKFRDQDINMKSTWICSRNDIVANIGVLLASFLVARFESSWPDVIIGISIAAILLKSSASILKESLIEFKKA